jgi:3'-phosphoadenosine 5'-phosphosulfate sulfotransferase (PAPS reductase)/FAD synthetase
MLAKNSVFRKLWAPNDLLVLMSDTGNEHPETYMHVESVKHFCDEAGIEFEFITSDMRFHKGNWTSLTDYFEAYDLVMTKVFNRACTDQLKIQPIYRYLNLYVSIKYGLEAEGGVYRGHRALVDFAEQNGKIRVLLGMSRGEEGRVSPDDQMAHEWMRLSVEKAYPLLWLGWDREDCQRYIRKIGKVVPPPSNCMFCPFMNRVELLWLARKYPEDFERWVGFERRKLKKFAHLGDRNHCVLHKTKTLRQVLADAEKQYGEWTLEQLEEYRFSHGHCVRSKY